MTSVEIAAQPGSRGLRLVDLLRSAPAQVRLALGTDGVAWATAAGLIGIICCIVSFAVVAMSLHATDADRRRQKAGELLALDLATRKMMGTFHLVTYGRATPEEIVSRLAEMRRSYDRAFVAACATAGPFPAPPPAMCRPAAAMRDLLLPELDAFDPPRRTIDRAVLARVIDLLEPFNAASTAAAREADSLTGALVEDYGATLLVLTFSTLGFAAAGLVLVLLVGRASMHYHAQWKAAQEARDTLRETIDLLPAGVVLYDAQERLTLFNSTAAEVTPMLRRRDAIGRTYEELVRERARIMAAAGRGPQPVEDWIRRFRNKTAPGLRQHEDGRWFEWTERSTRSGGTVGLRVDVTELKSRELAVERAQAEYSRLLGSLSDMVFKADLKTGTFTFAGGAAGELFGMAAEDLVGQPLLRFVAADDYLTVHEAGRRAYRAAVGSEVVVLQFRVRNRAGGVRHLEARFRRGIDEAGEAIITGVMRDIEERVQLGRRLEAETTRLRSIVESSGAMIALLDGELGVVMVNSGFSASTGIAEAQALGRPLQQVMHCPLDANQLERWRAQPAAERAPIQFAVKLGEAPAEGQGESQEAGQEAGQGGARERRLISVTATPIADAGGAVSSVVLLGVDDTERRDAEQALYDTERFATVGEMAATMAHELSQPLQVINIACASAVEELTEPVVEGQPELPFVQNKLERIAQQVGTAGRIISDLRAFVRGVISDHVGPFDLAAAVQSATDLTQHGLRQSGMVVRHALAADLPKVAGGSGRLEQVLINLIHNARDAGGRTLDIKGDTLMRGDRRYVRLAVEDTGPGIPAEVLPRLFVSFVSTKAKGKGTGLGLRICHRIVEEMGGTISAANRPEGGARFEIVLPAA